MFPRVVLFVFSAEVARRCDAGCCFLPYPVTEEKVALTDGFDSKTTRLLVRVSIGAVRVMRKRTHRTSARLVRYHTRSSVRVPAICLWN